jgi:hypothetical protein
MLANYPRERIAGLNRKQLLDLWVRFFMEEHNDAAVRFMPEQTYKTDYFIAKITLFWMPTECLREKLYETYDKHFQPVGV